MTDDFILMNEYEPRAQHQPKIIFGNQIWKPFPYRVGVRCTRSEAMQAKAHHPKLSVYDVAQWRKRTGSSGKVCILRCEGIGDLIMLGPSLRSLHASGWTVVLGLRAAFFPIAEMQPWIDEMFPFEPRLPNGTALMEPIGFDPKPYAAVYKLNHQVECDKSAEREPRVDIFARLLGVSLSDKEPWIEPDAQTIEEGKMIAGEGAVAVCLGTSTSRRDYRRMPELVQKLADAGKRVVLLHNKRVLDITHDNVVDLQGKLDVRQLIGVIAACDAIISPDTGPMHVGLAVGTPTIAIEGPQSPECYVAYYKTAHAIVQDESLPCLGCSRRQKTECTHGIRGDEEYACMKVDPRVIVETLEKLPAKKVIEHKPTERRMPEVAASPAPGKAPAVVRPRKLWMTMLFEDEPKELMDRFIENVIAHPAIERVLAVNGAASRNGLCLALAKTRKVETIHHPYPHGAFYASCLMRDVSFMGVPEGQHVVMMDPDELFSPKLAEWLPEFPGTAIQYGGVARAGWKTMEEAKLAGFRPPGTDNPHGWPDYQPRLLRWSRKMKWERGAHMILLNAGAPTHLPLDRYLIHIREENPHREEHNGLWRKQFDGWEARHVRKDFVPDYEGQIRELEEATHATV